MSNPTTPLHAMMLSYGMTKLAREMQVTPTTLYRWVKTNHVPAGKVTQLAELLDIPMSDAMDLIARDETVPTQATLPKPTGTLETLLEVRRGTRTLENAAIALGTPLKSLRKAYEINYDRLPVLYNTLKAYREKRVTRTEAMNTLGVSKAQFHYLIRTYGEAGEVPKRVVDAPPGPYLARKPVYMALALDVIAGRKSAKEAAAGPNVALRTLHRYITDLITPPNAKHPRSLTELSHWPFSFRAAWARELENANIARVIEGLIAYAQDQGLVLDKRVRPFKLPENWREAKVEMLLRTVLYGEKTLEEVAILRGGSETVIKNMFNGVLRGFGLSFDKLMSLGISHQIAVADLITMRESHYRRRNPVVKTPQMAQESTESTQETPEIIEETP